MPETTRTTVTLSRISMNQVKELVGVFGSTPASVISRVVEHFFDYGKFDANFGAASGVQDWSNATKAITRMKFSSFTYSPGRAAVLVP